MFLSMNGLSLKYIKTYFTAVILYGKGAIILAKLFCFVKNANVVGSLCLVCLYVVFTNVYLELGPKFRVSA